MNSIDLEIIMIDSVREGMQSVRENVIEMSTYISSFNKQINAIETSLSSMQVAFERAMRVGKDQTDNLAMLKVLREEINLLKKDLSSLAGQAQDTGNRMNIMPTVSKSEGNKQLTAAKEGLEGMNAIMSVAINTSSLFGGEQSKLIQIQAKLQAMLAITNGLQKIANVLNHSSYFSTVLLVRAKEMLTAANTALATSLGISTVAAQALMATLTLGLSVVITGLILLWDRYSSSQEEAAKADEAFRKRVADLSASSVVEFQKMAAEYDKLGDSLEAKQKYIDNNQEAFQRLGASINDVAEAENIFGAQKDVFINSLMLRANAAAIMELATDRYKKAIEKMMEMDSTPAQKIIPTWNEGDNMLDGKWETKTVDNPKKTKLKNEVDDLLAEFKKYMQQYLGISDEIQSLFGTAGIKPANIPIKGSIAEIKASISSKRQAQERVTSNSDYERLETEILIEQAKLDAIIGKKNDNSALKREQEALIQENEEAKMRARWRFQELEIAALAEGQEKELKQLKLGEEQELAQIKRSAERQMELYRRMKEKGLDVDLKKKKDELATQVKNETDAVIIKYAFKEQAIKDRDAENLAQQLAPYRTLAEQRLEIEEKYNEDIRKLRGTKDGTAEKDAQIEDAILIAEEAKTAALGELDRTLAEKDVHFRALMGQITNMSLDELQRALLQAQDALAESDASNGQDSKQTAVARAKVAAMTVQIAQLRAEEDVKGPDTQTKWHKNGEAIKKCKEEIDNMINSMDFLDDSTKNVLQAASNIAGGAIAMIDGVQKLSVGAAEGIKTVEKASVILAIIGTAVQMITSIFSMGSSAERRHQEVLAEVAANKLAMQREYNLLLLQQNLLMKEATNDFGERRIAKAARAIDVYRDSIKQYQSELQGEAPKMTGMERLFGGISGSFKKKMDEYKQGIGALASITIKTGHKKTGLFGWGKGKDIYSGVLDVYPDLIDGEHKLNIERAKTILNTQTMSDANKATLQSLVNLQEQAEKAQEELHNYIQDTFGSLGDGMLESITTAIQSGTDAWEIFGDKGAEVLENLGKQIAYSLFFADKFDELQKDLEAVYGSGKSEKEIANDAMNVLGYFYSTIGSRMDDAQDFMENWQAEAKKRGFDIWEQTDSEQSGRSGSFTTMSQEQGTKLEGLFTSVQDHVSSIDTTVFDISRSMYEASDSLVAIVRNTGYCYHLEQMAADISELKRDGIKMK